MAYDEGLAERIRFALAGRWPTSERRMFGGLAFLVDGRMAVAAIDGGIMVRVEPDETERLLSTTAAFPMEMRGRPMRGWLRVDAADLGTSDELAAWVARGASYAATLPAS
ncbi:TfoX/Sxy family protein [Nocardioides sp. SYSU DS0651]|uniref:TfoX/Sxy family protein n=1 Tax=Nocardioides sp. SYSU DS0651 TaxID=3415955 RepID=UPI003F4C0579